MRETILKIDHVSKRYKLGQIGGTTLKEEIQRWTARVRQKEDPTKRIGSKDYEYGEEFLALDDVCFEVKQGECVGIIGHNGAGKSTLLKLISRITAPSDGDIWLNGRVASMLEVGTGFHGELTGRENIYLNGTILGMSKAEISRKLDDIVAFSECEEFLDTPLKRYSSGMVVRLGFAVAAHLETDILIIDEVLAVGDAAFQKKAMQKIQQIAQDKSKTIIFVSHNMDMISQLCTRCLWLQNGQIGYLGDTQTCINTYLQSNA